MAVTGIGGLFLRARDPRALAAWYAQHLGVGPAEAGWTWHQQAGPTVFAPFEHDTDYFPADKAFMLNLRVDELDGLLARLRASGIEVIERDEWNDPQTGRFARLHDPEGNPVELWLPPE